MRLSARFLLPLALLLATLIPGPASAADTPPALDGTAWTLASLPGRTLIPARGATLQFAAGRATGTDGCNRFSGSYSATADGRFQIKSVAQTEMACPADPGGQAQAFMAALNGAHRLRLEANALVLLDAAGAVLATLAVQGDALAGTTWTVTGYGNGRQAVASVLRDSVVTVEFGADGHLSGASGCNRYTGHYGPSTRTVTIGTLAVTRRACAAPAGVMEQEAAFLKALRSAARLRFEGDRLELRTVDDKLAVSATRGTTGSEIAADVAATESARTRTFAADLVYMADAAVVTVCVTGRRYPVAMQADYRRMERAYVAQARPPGSALHVTFEGAIVDRPKIDGVGAGKTVVVKRFIHTWPGETCERARADASLANTYWKIVRLGATDVNSAEGRREPHLLIRSPAKGGRQGDYSATVGCNTINGRYSVDGATMSFAPGASTRMACAPPLDDLERRLGAMLARAARWQVAANTLELFDAGGGTVGLFQAVYF